MLSFFLGTQLPGSQSHLEFTSNCAAEQYVSARRYGFSKVRHPRSPRRKSTSIFEDGGLSKRWVTMEKPWLGGFCFDWGRAVLFGHSFSQLCEAADKVLDKGVYT